MKEETGGAVLELLMAETPNDEGGPRRGPDILVGTFRGFDGEGRPCVALPDASPDQAQPARSIVLLDQSHVGCQVVLAFERNDRRKLIVMGVLQECVPATPGSQVNDGREGVEAALDGETLVLTAKREIVLRCGKSSITLTRAGKVLIRGAYLLSGSSGVNRLKG